MKKLILPTILFSILVTSCVSKKKYVDLEQRYVNAKAKNQELQMKFDKIEKRVDDYNAKINSLKDANGTLKNENVSLELENSIKYDVRGNLIMSDEKKKQLNKTLAKVDSEKLKGAKTLKDSLNIALAYNFVEKNLGKFESNDTEDINIDIDETVVMISVSDKLLFNTASYRVKNSAMNLLTKLANIIESEPSMDVMIEGHTDSRTINNAVVQDNWDLSVKRATSIVRLLQNKFNIDGSRLIASGRGDTMPLFPNDSKENRAKNRRTRIVILPNLDKFFALLADEDEIEIKS